MAALKNEGLILIEPRRAPVVADQAPGSEEQYEEAVILSQKNMILSVWQTIALLMPSIFTFASQDCHIEALPHYKQAMRAGKGNITGAWRPLNLLCKEILDASDNPLFSHLFATFDLYTCLPYFTEKSTYFIDEFLRPADRVTFAIIEALKMESRVEKCQYIRRMYQALHDDIRLSIDNLERKFSKSPPHVHRSFSHAQFIWKPDRGRDYQYLRIVQNLTSKIEKGVLPIGSMVYESALAEEYAVSVSTVRNALAILRQRGFVQTINGKGSQIVLPAQENIVYTPLLSPIRKNIIQYLNALQFMILISGPCAYYAASHNLSEDIEWLEKQAGKSGIALLSNLFQSVLNHIDVEPLRIILGTVNQMIKWGYYLVFYTWESQTVGQIGQLSHKAFKNLQNEDYMGFANEFSNCYRCILENVREYMAVNYHLRGALGVQTPPPMPL